MLGCFRAELETAFDRTSGTAGEIVLKAADSLRGFPGIEQQRIEVELNRLDREEACGGELIRLPPSARIIRWMQLLLYSWAKERICHALAADPG